MRLGAGFQRQWPQMLRRSFSTSTAPVAACSASRELGDKIAAASKTKCVIAVANSLAASAAFWLASQASELVVTPGGQVGSIGVFAIHVDESAFDPAIGRAVTIVKAGERKNAEHPYGPLDQTGRESMQSTVNDYYAKFVRAVARGRNATQSAVKRATAAVAWCVPRKRFAPTWPTALARSATCSPGTVSARATLNLRRGPAPRFP